MFFRVEAVEADEAFWTFAGFSANVVEGAGEVDVLLGSPCEFSSRFGGSVESVVVYVGHGFQSGVFFSSRVNGIHDIGVLTILVVRRR